MFLDVALPSKFGRLALVPPSETDDAAVSAIRSHPETRRYLRFFPEVFSVADAHARRTSRSTDLTIVDFHIHLLNTPTAGSSTFIGTSGIFHIDDTDFGRACEVGILISPDYFRGGLATETLHTVLVYAFETRNLHRAEFNTGSDNLAMRGWLEKAGATLEGRKRDAWADPTTGGYTDVCMYSILQDEWRTTVKGRLEARMNRAA